MAFKLVVDALIWASLVALSCFKSPEISSNELRAEGLLRQSVSSSDGLQGSTKYYLSREAMDFVEANEVCQGLGHGYGLASILTQDDLHEILDFLSNKSPRGHIWIGGSWRAANNTFVWVNIKDANGQPVHFADFVLELFDRDLPTPTINDRTLLYMEDQFKAVLKIDSFTNTRRFLCQNRNSFNRTTATTDPTAHLPVKWRLNFNQN